jgi:hypothetical protein
MKIQHVPIDFVNQVWSQVERYLEPAIQYGQGDYTLEHIRVFVTSGQQMLVVATDESGVIQGAAVINFFNRPTDRVAFVTVMGGKLITGEEPYKQFSNILKSFGATYIEGASRESAARLWQKFGLEEKYRVVGAKL